jgi:hypothetical protein
LTGKPQQEAARKMWQGIHVIVIRYKGNLQSIIPVVTESELGSTVNQTVDREQLQIRRQSNKATKHGLKLV